VSENPIDAAISAYERSHPKVQPEAWSDAKHGHLVPKNQRAKLPSGLLRADGSLCLDLLPMEYYGEAFRVVQGPLYNPESIDRDKVYATTSVAGIHPDRVAD